MPGEVVSPVRYRRQCMDKSKAVGWTMLGALAVAYWAMFRADDAEARAIYRDFVTEPGIADIVHTSTSGTVTAPVVATWASGNTAAMGAVIPQR